MMTHRAALSFLAVAMLALTACESDQSKDKDAGADAAVSQTAQGQKPAESGGTDRSGGELGARPRATSGRGTVSEKPPLDIDHLLSTDDIQRVAPDTTFESEPLAGVSADSDFNARRFRPADGAFGAALEVWSFDHKEAAAARFDSLKEQYLDKADELPEGVQPLADRAFLSTRTGIRQLVLQLETPARVLVVSCGKSVCDSNGKLTELTEKVIDRVGTAEDEE